VAESTYQARRERLLGLLAERRTAAAAFSHLPNIRYLTGFSGSNAVFLLSERDAVLYTDPRYELQAAGETDCKVRVVRGALWPEVVKSVRRRRAKSLGLEAELLAQAEYARIGDQLGPGVPLSDVSGLAERLRAVKDAGEIELIRRSNTE
jgi:Xaa-Pro aminopeptidase